MKFWFPLPPSFPPFLLPSLLTTRLDVLELQHHRESEGQEEDEGGEPVEFVGDEPREGGRVGGRK